MGAIDYLTCGSCQAEFPLSSIVIFMQHKRMDCSFVAHANDIFTEESIYDCYTCPKRFHAAISLLQHAQYQHKQMIFREKTNINNRNSDDQEISNEQTIESINTKKENTEKIGNNSKLLSLEYNDLAPPLSKCCTAVVPKKRKRHIETKHRSSLLKSRLRRERLQQLQPHNIYIDVDQSSADSEGFNGQSNRDQNQTVLLKPGNSYKFPINARYTKEFVDISYAGSEESCPLIQSKQVRQQHNPHGTNRLTKTNWFAQSQYHRINSATTESTSLSTTGRDSPANGQKKKYPTSKPYKCDYCENSFNQRIHLKKHLSKHTGVKPYKCDQCDYATVERSHLKVHIRIHTGEKPFKCNHCEYATAQNSTLKIHLKRHHGGVFLECSHCGKSFPEKDELYKHKQEHDATLAAPIESIIDAEQETSHLIPKSSSINQ